MMVITLGARLLISALQLEELHNKYSFTQEDLAVEVWKMFPEVYGMTGYEKLYPDLNKVISNLFGTKGLVAKGYFFKRGKTITLMPRGRQIAYETADALGIPLGKKRDTPIPENGLTVEDNLRLTNILEGEVWQKWYFGQKEEITVPSIIRYWGVDATCSDVTKIEEGMSETDKMIDLIKTIMAATRGNLILPNRRQVTWDDMVVLQQIQKFVKVRAKPAMDILRHRSKNKK